MSICESLQRSKIRHLCKENERLREWKETVTIALSLGDTYDQNLDDDAEAARLITCLRAELEKAREDSELLKCGAEHWRDVERRLEYYLTKARENGREDAELECIRLECSTCREDDDPATRVKPWHWRHKGEFSCCGATHIHELRYQRARAANKNEGQ